MKQQQRFKVEIPKHEKQDNKIYYIIEVSEIVNEENKKTIKKRYSELEAFHQKIMDWIKIFKLKIVNLNFPKKKIFISTNNSEENIIKRRNELQIYFNEILAHPELQGSSVVEDLLPQIKQKKQDTVTTQWSESEEIKKLYLAKHQNQTFSLPNQDNNKQQKQQYLFHFEDHFFLDSYAIYTINITDTYVNKSWKFNQRYSDLRDNHRQLQKLNLTTKLPEFPEKKIITKTDLAIDLKERKNQLEAYLNQLFKYSEIVSTNILVFFIAKSQLDLNEIGCRSKGPSQTTLESSSIKSQSNITNATESQFDDSSPPQNRKITC